MADINSFLATDETPMGTDEEKNRHAERYAAKDDSLLFILPPSSVSIGVSSVAKIFFSAMAAGHLSRSLSAVRGGYFGATVVLRAPHGRADTRGASDNFGGISISIARGKIGSSDLKLAGIGPIYKGFNRVLASGWKRRVARSAGLLRWLPGPMPAA